MRKTNLILMILALLFMMPTVILFAKEEPKGIISPASLSAQDTQADKFEALYIGKWEEVGGKGKIEIKKGATCLCIRVNNNKWFFPAFVGPGGILIMQQPTSCFCFGIDNEGLLIINNELYGKYKKAD